MYNNLFLSELLASLHSPPPSPLSTPDDHHPPFGLKSRFRSALHSIGLGPNVLHMLGVADDALDQVLNHTLNPPHSNFKLNFPPATAPPSFNFPASNTRGYSMAQSSPPASLPAPNALGFDHYSPSFLSHGPSLRIDPLIMPLGLHSMEPQASNPTPWPQHYSTTPLLHPPSSTYNPPADHQPLPKLQGAPEDPFQFCAEDAGGTIRPCTQLSTDMMLPDPFSHWWDDGSASWLIGSSILCTDAPSSMDCLADPAWTYNNILAGDSLTTHPLSLDIFNQNTMATTPVLDIEDFSKPAASRTALPLIPIGFDSPPQPPSQLWLDSGQNSVPLVKGKGTRARKHTVDPHLVDGPSTLPNAAPAFQQCFGADQPVQSGSPSFQACFGANQPLNNGVLSAPPFSLDPDNTAEVDKKCHNCHVPFTPLWRRGLNDEVLCNACGLYVKLHGNSRPASLCTNPSRPLVTPQNECGNCRTTETSLWRKGPDGIVLCNACQLFWKLHRKHRVPSFKPAGGIRKRKRARRTVT